MAMGVLAFIAAESREFSGLLARATQVRRLDLDVAFGRCFELHGHAALAAANGPGPELAGKALDVVRGMYELEAVISIGYCGAVDPVLRPNDIVVGARVNGNPARLPSTTRDHVSGVVFSSDRVVVSAREKQDLRQTGAIAVEMEAAGLAARAERWCIPFYCVRVVTDTAAESLPLDFNACRASDGRFSRSRIIMAALRR